MAEDREHLFIGGTMRRAHGADRLTVIDPATEQPYGSVPDADGADVDAAVEAAREAFRRPGWADLEPAERAVFIDRLADALERRSDVLGPLVTHENGTPIAQSMVFNGLVPLFTLRYFADLARGLRREEIRPEGENHAIVRKEPVGVCALIVPWNYPQILLSHKLGPALVAGCTVVVKPAPETPLDAYVLAEAIEEAGIPPGVVNIVTGGPETGRHLVRHHGIDKVAFTGSTAVGREIAELCGRELRPLTLELGGKSAAIVLEDADLAGFTGVAVETCAPNTGQTCFASTRVLAPRSRYDEVVDALVDAFSSAKTGNPFEQDTVFGPLVSAKQRARVEGYLRIGEEEGAKVAVGGRPADLPVGYYVSPTVFRDVDNRMRIAREEIFGPVVVVIAYDGEEDAVAIANDSEYGLGGSVFSADADHATDVARRVETGTIGVNSYRPGIAAPFGGRKSSGIGRELGPEGLAPYVVHKSIYRPGPA